MYVYLSQRFVFNIIFTTCLFDLDNFLCYNKNSWEVCYVDLKNPFALRDGKIIMVEDLGDDERGLACNCRCPACNDRFEARLGNVRVHHFSHNGEGCDEVAAFLSGMYMLVKEFIDANEIKLPPLNVYWAFDSVRYTAENFFSRIRLKPSNGFYNTTNVYPEKTLKFDCSEIVYKNKKPIAIVLTCRENKIALRIKPPATVCKQFEIKQYENMATICFDASNIKFGELNKNDISKILLTETDNWSWIFTDKALKALNEINRRNDLRQKQIQKECEEAQKKRAEALRLQEEKRKRNQELELMRKQQQQTALNSPKASSMPKERFDKDKMYSKGYEEVKDKDFYQQDEIIRDRFDQRWVICRNCGKIDLDINFSEYGGIGSTNLGVCRDCTMSSKLFI